MQRFINSFVSREHRFALGTDAVQGGFYLSIPVANRMVDYQEYYSLEVEEYKRLTDDLTAALQFADQCRARRHDGRLILKPGTDRGEPT